MSWKKINLSNDQVIRQESRKLMGIFSPLFLMTPQPHQKGAALFSTFNTDDGSGTVYISPKAVEIIGDAFSDFLPIACEKPRREGLSLLHGDANAFSLVD